MDATELSPINTPINKKVQYVAVVVITLAKLGDSVEIFLPSVITQKISCELDLSVENERILSLSLYASLALSTIFSILFARSFGRRSTILVALHLSVIVSVICALVPNYITLLLSRIAIGFCIGINHTTLSIYMAEICTDKKILAFAITVTSVGYSFGGGWAGGLGYLFLEPLGWRWFLLVSSVPLFVPAIIAFHFYLPSTSNSSHTKNSSEENDDISTSKTSMNIRIAKINMYILTRAIPFRGTILLIPAILQDYNIKNHSQSPCHAIHDLQFLIITAVFGVSHLPGRLLGYVLNDKFSPGFLLSGCGICCSVFLAMMCLFFHNIRIVLVCMGVVQLLFSSSTVSTNILASDSFFFTPSMLAISTGLRYCTQFALTMIGNTISEVLPSTTAVKIHLAFGILNLFCGLSFISCNKPSES